MKVVFGSVGPGPNDVFPVIAEEIAVSVYYLEIVYTCLQCQTLPRAVIVCMIFLIA